MKVMFILFFSVILTTSTLQLNKPGCKEHNPEKQKPFQIYLSKFSRPTSET